MRTKSVIYSSVVSLLIAIAVYNEGFSQQVEICATCPGNDVLGHQASAFGLSNIASGSYSFVAGLQSEASKPAEDISVMNKIVAFREKLAYHRDNPDFKSHTAISCQFGISVFRLS